MRTKQFAARRRQSHCRAVSAARRGSPLLMAALNPVLLVLALAAAGCSSTSNSNVLLQRDLRMQEDKIYHLQSCLEDAHAAREATIRENEALKSELAGGDRGPGASSGPSTRGGGNDLVAPSIELPGAESTPPSGPRSRTKGNAPDLQPPIIELPEGSDQPPVETKSGNGQAIVDEGPPTQLVINKRLTGGLDRDGQDGDEGILVVVEPRNAAGHLVKSPGTVSVVLMDPAQEGEGARVARWDFAADEVPNHFMNTVFSRGLQFELPWPSTLPKNRELQLFVRFTTPDGKKLTTDTKIDVRPPSGAPAMDRQTKRWSPAPQNGSSDRRGLRSRLRARANETEAPRATARRARPIRRKRRPAMTAMSRRLKPGDRIGRSGSRIGRVA